MKFLKKLPLFLAIIAGLVGAALRGHELVYCYNANTYTYFWDSVSKLLVGIGAFMTVLFFVWSLILQVSEEEYAGIYKFGTGGAVASVFAGLGLMAIGALTCLSFMYTRSLIDVTFGALTVFAGISFIIQTVLRKNSEKHSDGFWFVVPIFWGCYLVIRTFMENPVEPVVQVFAADLLSVSALLLAIYGCAAKMFTHKQERLTVFATLMTVMLIIASVGGRACAAYFTGSYTYLLGEKVIVRVLCSVVLLPLMITNANLLLSRLEFVSSEKEDEEI